MNCDSCNRECRPKAVVNLQRLNGLGKPMWVTTNVPLRFIPQSNMLKANLCEKCHGEYADEITKKELVV